MACRRPGLACAIELRRWCAMAGCAVEITWPDRRGARQGQTNPRWKSWNTPTATGLRSATRSSAMVYGEAQDGTVLTGWETGYPDLHALPDLEAFARSPGASEPGSCYRRRRRSRCARADRASNRLTPPSPSGSTRLVSRHASGSSSTPLITPAHRDCLGVLLVGELGELDPVLQRIFEHLEGIVELEGATPE